MADTQGSNNPATSGGRQSRVADLNTSTPSPQSERDSAPSPSPGISAFVAAREARPQSLQTTVSPSRPAPLFTSRPPARQKHTNFKTVKIHTAKCDVCNHHNTATLNRCVDCGWQICTPCLTDRGGDSTHTGGPGQSTTPNNRASSGANPRPNISAANPATPVNTSTTRSTPPANIPPANASNPVNVSTIRATPPSNVPATNTAIPDNAPTTTRANARRNVSVADPSTPANTATRVTPPSNTRASNVATLINPATAQDTPPTANAELSQRGTPPTTSTHAFPEPPGAELPLHINDFAYPAQVHTYSGSGLSLEPTTPYNPPDRVAYSRAHVMPVPVLAGLPAIPTMSYPNVSRGTLPDPFVTPSSATTLQEGPMNRVMESSQNPDKKNTKKKSAKGKGKEMTLGDKTGRDSIVGTLSAEGCDKGKKAALRPRKLVNYYPEHIPMKDTDTDKKVDEDDSASEGGDIPYESPNAKPTVGNRFGSASRAPKGKNTVETRKKKATRDSRTVSEPRDSPDPEVESGSDNLLQAAAEALLELSAGKKANSNGEGSSQAGPSSMANQKQTTSKSNKKHSQEKSVPSSPSSSTVPAKRKRKGLAAQLRPAVTQNAVHRDFRVYTDVRDDGSASSDVEMKDAPALNEEPESKEAATSTTDPKIKAEANEDQDVALANAPEGPSRGSASGARPEGKKVSPRLQELYRSALRVKDRNGKLKRLHNRGPRK